MFPTAVAYSTLLRVTLFSFIALIVGAPEKAQAEIYKWQDAKGRVHYSDSAPKNTSSYRDVTPDLPPIHRMESGPARAMGSRVEPSEKQSSQMTPRPHRHVEQVYDRYSHSESSYRNQCDSYRDELERIQKRLRSGYKESTGNRLRDRRRELSDLLYQKCRR